MCTLLFQAASGEGIPNEIHELIVTCAGLANQWLTYKIARQAVRYSQYKIGGDVVKPLTVKVRRIQIHVIDLWHCEVNKLAL